MLQSSSEKLQKQKHISIGLLVALIVVSVALVVMSVLFSVYMNKYNQTQSSLEAIYQRNFTEFVDSINNSEIKLSKIVASNYDSYAKKLLSEVSKNANEASNNLSTLPLSVSGLEETIRFVNQVSGYTKTLSDKIADGKQITQQEKQVLIKLRESFLDLKNQVNKISNEVYNGNIYEQSLNLSGDYNDFTLTMQGMKSSDIDYPTMIYDGPFSDSTVNKQIKNLNGNDINSQDARQCVLQIFTDVNESNLQYLGETNGRFSTYDFLTSDSEERGLYVQVTKKEGKLLTVSGQDVSDDKNYTIDQAIEIAKNFASNCDIENPECVWSDVVGANAYINIAPIKNNVVLYPDLVKVKVDLATGDVIGYEACSYYMNHVDRKIANASISSDTAKNLVATGHQVSDTKLVLAPLEYNREVLCWEFKTNFDGDVYYFYVNAQNGQLENILRIIQTEDGNLLM